MDKEEKLNELLRRKEKADSLPPKEKLKWKNEIIKIEQEIKLLKIELEKPRKTTEEELTILHILALNKAAVQYLYENFIDKNSIVIKEFIDEIIIGINDYFETKDNEHLTKAKTLTNVLLDTIYQNNKAK